MSMKNLFERYADIKARREEGEGGFTLIELLVVVVIIGILVAIAIPLYLHYQQGAQEKSVKSDVRNAVAAISQCYSDNNSVLPAGGTFLATGALVGSTSTACADDKIIVSTDTTKSVTFTPDTATGNYTVTGTANDGTTTWVYSSTSGNITKGAAPATTP